MSNWTPGPWRVEAQSISQGRAWRWGVHHSNEATDDNDIIGWEIDDKANAELIALAPEMAEAILSLDRLSCTTHTRLFGSDGFETFSASCVECGAILKVRKLAAKLRAIGEDNE